MSDPEPRELNAEECIKNLLWHFKNLVQYWAHHPDPRSVEDRMDGLVFSILSTLDGASLDTPSWLLGLKASGANSNIPSWFLAPDPHEDDREYCIDVGENWWPENAVELKGCYTGQLHELWVSMKDKKG